MPTDKKRSRKKRGSVSSGHGRVGKHRKHPGGRGRSGGQHHHRIMFDKYYPGYFGKKGMRNYHKNKQEKFCPTMNLNQLSKIIQNFDDSEKNTTSFSRLNLLNSRCYKVLGKGRILSKKINIEAKVFSKKAARKIINTGGTIKLV